MLTKRTAPVVPIALTPAMQFLLMVGHPAPGRIHGWVTLAQAGRYGEPEPSAAWAAHREELLQEAKAAGFEAFWERKRTPSGARFLEWRARFLGVNTY